MSLERIVDLRDWHSCLSSIRQRLDFTTVEARTKGNGAKIADRVWATYDEVLCEIAEGMLHTVLDSAQPAEAALELERFAAELAGLQPEPAAGDSRGQVARAYRELCRDFAQVQQGLPAVVETFRVYAEGNCRLIKEPEAVLKEAEQRLLTEPQIALSLIGEAGCLYLRGLGEVDALPLQAGVQFRKGILPDWLAAVASVVGSISGNLEEYPLGELELARDQRRAPSDTTRIEYKRAKLARLGVEEPEVQDLLLPLFAPQKQRPSTAEKQAIIDAGPRVVPGLIAIAGDYDSQLIASVSEGEAAIRAVELLGDMRAAEAVPTLLGILKESDWMLIIRDAALRALQDKMPDLAFPAALEHFDHIPDSAFKTDLAGILAKGGRGKPEVFERLIKHFREAKKERDLLAGHLADLGDPRALPDLHEEFRKSGDWMAVGEIEAAIVELGGELSAAEQEKVQRLRPTPLLARLSAARPPQATQSAEMGQARAAKIGRNEPCPCGSGKKYKKCHGR